MRTWENTEDLTLFNGDFWNEFESICWCVCEHGNYILKVKRAICASQGASTRLPLTDKQVVQLKRHTSG